MWLESSDQKCRDIVFLETQLTLRQECNHPEKVDYLFDTTKSINGKVSINHFGGVFSNKLLYCLFAADKIQISKTTWLMLSMKGGYIMEERGFIEVKVI